jgi:hypothetical protein
MDVDKVGQAPNDRWKWQNQRAVSTACRVDIAEPATTQQMQTHDA